MAQSAVYTVRDYGGLGVVKLRGEELELVSSISTILHKLQRLFMRKLLLAIDQRIWKDWGSAKHGEGFST